MITFVGQSAPQIQILAYLDHLARAGHGYELRGVRGWAKPADVEAAPRVYAAAEKLRRAFRRGHLTRQSVSVPDAKRPVWIYRITDSAARELADLRGRAYVPLPPPLRGGEPRALMPSTVAVALDALRHAAEHPGTDERIPGEPEWRTSLELTRWLHAEVESTGIDRVFQPGDLEWLVTRELAQRRALPPPLPGGKRPVILYRITVTGAAIKPLEWFGPLPGGAPRPGDGARGQGPPPRRDGSPPTARTGPPG